MEIEEIKTLLSGLNIHDSINILSEKDIINGIINVLDHNYKVMKIDENIYCVARISDNKEKKTERIDSAISKLTSFNSVNVDGDVAYIRSLVSMFNRRNNDFVKVRKNGNKAELYRNRVMFKNPITLNEMNAIKAELHEMLFPLYDVADNSNELI